MARSPRIEFEGAVYHVMARGNRREPIVFDRGDRELFWETFGDACAMTAWEVYAVVLMSNHYHAVLRTPFANLVEGMKWFQNAYTRRLNTRKELWGHLFGGRYRSLLIEPPGTGESDDDYLATAIDYIHLNPARARLVDGRETSLLDYEWSSLSRGYALSPGKRPSWLASKKGFELMNKPDTAAGRRRLVESLDGRIRSEQGAREIHGVSFGARVKRGWYWGSEEFREKMKKEVDSISLRKNPNYRSSSMGKDHREQDAERIIESALEHYGVEPEALRAKIYGDQRRASVAWRLARETTVPQSWIAERLDLKTSNNTSRIVSRFSKLPDRSLPKVVRKWKTLKIID